jgi:hypothetical protein
MVSLFRKLRGSAASQLNITMVDKTPNLKSISAPVEKTLPSKMANSPQSSQTIVLPAHDSELVNPNAGSTVALSPRSKAWLIAKSHTCDFCSKIVLDSTSRPYFKREIEFDWPDWDTDTDVPAPAAHVDRCPLILKATSPDAFWPYIIPKEKDPFLEIEISSFEEKHSALVKSCRGSFGLDRHVWDMVAVPGA